MLRKPWLLQRLYFRVLLALVGAIAVVLAGMTALNIRGTEERLANELIQRGQSQAKILAYTGSLFLVNNDTRGLSLIAQTVIGNHQAEKVAFYSDTGTLVAGDSVSDAPINARAAFDELLSQLKSSGAGVQHWANGYLEIAEPITYTNKRIGTVAIRIGTDDLEASRVSTLRQGSITALSLITLLSLLVGVLLRQLVIIPLQRLSATTKLISDGTWAVPAGQERRDEFGQLARSFGQMVTAVQTRETQLQDQMARAEALNTELDARVVERTRELHELVAGQGQLLTQIRQMSTPVVPVLQGVIVVPIIGSLDSQRAAQLIQRVLAGIEEHRAHLAVLDITGVPVVDTQVARIIMQTASAARLLGTTAVVVGIRPEVAQTLVQLGLDLSGIQTVATLQEALRLSIARGVY
jgi:anti-anti-sigma regulatory factor/HAMP domain-containing protein